MFKNYLIIVFRNLTRQKTYSIINLSGLAIGFACSLLILIHVYTELSYDDHFKDAEDIHRLAVKASLSGNEFEAAVTGGPLAHILKSELPEISGYTRLREGTMTLLSIGEKYFYEENILYADSSFFEIFSFDLLQGESSTALMHPCSIVLTERMAKKIFGAIDPVGEKIKWNNDQHYTVTGILKDPDQKTHLDFDILVSFSTLYQNERFRDLLQSLFAYTTLNYIKIYPGTDKTILEAKINEVVKRHMGEELTRIGGKYEIFLQPVTSIYLHSNILHELKTNGNITNIYMFSAVAIFILVIACINYINLSTARSARRSREVGVRKVFGANKGMLFRQFITESVVVVGMGLILAILLILLALPIFNNLTGDDITIDFLLKRDYVIFLFAVLFIVGFLAGSYPAIYLSRFNPISVLKGSFYSKSKKSNFRNTMVILQFIISIFLVSITLLIYRQLSYMHNKDLGINIKNTVIIALRHISMTANYNSLKAEIKNLPGVLDVTGSSSYLGNFQQRRGFYPEGGDDDDMILLLNIQTDPNYLQVFNARLLQGRNFFENSMNDSNAIIINKAYQDKLGWKDPLNKQIFIPGDRGEKAYPLKIVGVVDNFNFASLHADVMPLIIMNQPERIRYLAIKITPENQHEVIQSISSKWKVLYPDFPFEYFMQQTKYEELYTKEVNMSRLFVYFTILATLIAAIGLYGLSSFIAEQRTKEIGIRKVLGSQITQILILLSKEFARLTVIAIIIAFPLSWYGMDKWLQNFAFQTNIPWWIFAISGLMAILITYSTTVFHALKASRTNPVEALKFE
jgi:putative ABC transport system permease protein